MSIILPAIQAELKHAEERRVKDESAVNVWLEELKDVSYSMDDVLDEWNTEILRLQIEGVDDDALVLKVRSFFNRFCLNEVAFRHISLFLCCFDLNPVLMRYKIAHRIKNIKKKLDVIVKVKNDLNFNISSSTTEEPMRIETSSIIVIPEMYGRDLDKEDIISNLLSEGSSSHQQGLPVISIVGMGGLGKTTLAQQIFNDDRVKTHFDKTMWICVSDPFDRTRVAKAIMEATGQRVLDNIHSWEALLQCLHKYIEGKLFLVVLDDVWTEEYQKWEPFRASLNSGARGSKILVTTHNEGVADMMDSTYRLNLKMLSEYETWSLFSGIAFDGKKEEEHKELEGIGKKIASKCKGLPLAAKTIGSLLRLKRMKREWLNVLKNETWKAEGGENGVLSALWLSYYDLPSHLKCCFAYCAIFPKDYWINRERLIRMWMAQGFLSSTRDEEMETVGGEYFDNLVMRSLFHATNVDKFGKASYCNMHDFTQFLTKKECFIIENKADEKLCLSAKTRHLNLTCSISRDIVPSICEAVNLRTLQFQSIGIRFFYADKVFPVSLCNLTCLRSLDLSESSPEELPKEIEKLIHLRYLNLSSSEMKELPETVTKLYNLPTLDLGFCTNLVKLPQGIGNLRKMRHLDIRYTRKLTSLPKGIERLCSLQTLSVFIVTDNPNGCKIGELKDLNHLKGKLRIRLLGNIVNGDEAKEAKLKNKHHLRGLTIEFNDHACAGGGEEMKRCERVVEGLQLHPNLERLSIRNYPGTKFPNDWMTEDDDGLTLLSNLRKMKIINCANLLRLSKPKLPPEMDNNDDDDDDDINIMPNLCDMHLYKCYNLKALPRHLSHTQLRVLWVFYCPALSWTSSSCLLLPLLEKLFLKGDAGVLSRSLAPNHICLPNLKTLKITHSPSLPEGLGHITSLQILRIWSSDSIINKLSEEVQHLNMLQELQITVRSEKNKVK